MFRHFSHHWPHIALCAAAVTILGCSIIVLDKQPEDTSGAFTLSDDDNQEDFALAHANATTSLTGSYLAGRSASFLGDHQSASFYLDKVLQEEPDNTYVRKLLMQNAMLSGQVDKAISLAAQEKAENKGRLSRQLLFVTYVNDKDFDKAASYAKTLQPSGIHALIMPFIDSWMAFYEDGVPKRITIADGLTHGRYHALQYYHYALQYAQAGDAKEAALNFDLALEQMQDAPDAVIFGAIRFALMQDDESKASQILELAKTTYNRDPLWRSIKADALFETLRNTDLAIDTIKDGIAESYSNIGALLMSEGALEEATYFASLAQYLRPDNMFIVYNYARLLEESGNITQALEVFDSLDTNSFLKSAITLSKARLIHEQGDKDKARTLLQHSNMSHDYAALVMLGDMARVDKKYSQAATYYTNALDALGPLQQSDWRLLFQRGMMYDQTKEWNKAEADLQEALELEPEQPQVLNYLAYSWIVRGEKLKQSEEMLKSALEQRPNDAQIIDSYGWALYQQERYAEALPYLEKALSLYPSDPTINDHYGDILWRMGRMTEAKYQWERALLFDPPEEEDVASITHKITYGMEEHPAHSMVENSN